MSYPTITPQSVNEFTELLRDAHGEITDGALLAFLREHVVNADGPSVDLAPLADAAAKIQDHLKAGEPTTVALEKLEGDSCGAVFVGLDSIPIEVLDDASFWSFVAIRYFWRFIVMREHKSFETLVRRAPTPDDDDAGMPLRRYFDGSDVYQIPLRMYIRAQAVRDGDDFSLAAAVPSGTDFWRSHVIRVSTAYHPPLARALARKQARSRLATTELRAAVRRINRYRVNMDPGLLDEDDQISVIDSLWPDS